MKKLKSVVIRAMTLFKSEKGGTEIILMIIFVSILVLAVLASKPIVDGTFHDTLSSWRTWLSGKLNTLFS